VYEATAAGFTLALAFDAVFCFIDRREQQIMVYDVPMRKCCAGYIMIHCNYSLFHVGRYVVAFMCYFEAVHTS
jgi:hypothetical protein